MTMTYAEAIEEIRAMEEDGDISEEEVCAYFCALAGREPDDEESREYLWDFCCSEARG